MNAAFFYNRSVRYPILVAICDSRLELLADLMCLGLVPGIRTGRLSV